MRFTVDGSEALEDRISQHMAQIRAGVEEVVAAGDLCGLILGGGYGRGEGGVYVVHGTEQVYNDYDFFVVVPYTSRSRRKALSAKLNQVKARFEPTCGIHVDFGPPMPESELPKQPYELMFMELKAGHHVLIGDEAILDGLPDYDESRPPLEECARLFMNRGVGLLMADQLLKKNPDVVGEDHEFVVRNIYKALLAAGDAVLFVSENYSASYVERKRRFDAHDLAGVPQADALRAGYEAAMAFKFRPAHEQATGEALVQWHRDVVALFGEVFLWFERQRLQDPALTWAAYQARDRRLPELSGQGQLKNTARNLRWASTFRPTWGDVALHPRDRVLSRLPGLLFEGQTNPQDIAMVLKFWEYYG